MRIPPVNLADLTDARLPEILLEVNPVRVAMLTRGRNAWHNCWVRHYQGETAKYTDAGTARSDAETRRGPGNVFYVTEAPALYLSGRFTHVIVVDFHQRNPFARYRGYQAEKGQGALYPGVPLVDALASFNHDSPYWDGAAPSRHSVRTGIMTFLVEKVQPLRRNRLHTWSSYARGTQYRLGWKRVPPWFSTAGTRAVVRRWSELAETIPDYRSRLDLMRRIQKERSSYEKGERDRKSQRLFDALNSVEDLLTGFSD